MVINHDSLAVIRIDFHLLHFRFLKYFQSIASKLNVRLKEKTPAITDRGLLFLWVVRNPSANELGVAIDPCRTAARPSRLNKTPSRLNSKF
jgi:hypothetical protein